MNLPDGLLYLIFAAISLLSAAAGVVLTGLFQRVTRGPGPRDRQELGAPPPQTQGARRAVDRPRRYEFRDGRLISEVAGDDPFLAPDMDRAYAPKALGEAMATLHPDLPDRVTALMIRGQEFFLVGYLGQDPLSVSGGVEGDRLVLTVTAEDDATAPRPADIRHIDAVEREAADLRRLLRMTEAVQWTEAAGGRVVWANQGYLALCEGLGLNRGDLPRWPLPHLFGEQLDPPPTDGSLRRCHLPRPDGDGRRWFEVVAARLDETRVLFSARPVDRLVNAEDSLRDFVQTLSKTFATLPIGLAVFDRKRELVLFNPALVSTSRLDPAFLSRRPTLRGFLDQLREVQRMPEPRDYRSWRDEMARLEQDAEEDRYHELWTLPGGESLRVTGRPHPNGAIAFMFEDISQEVSLTRRFRTDRELDRAILDDAGAALIVLDREGHVLRTNAAYDAMFDRLSDPAANSGCADAMAPRSLTDAASQWQTVFAPTGLWGEIRQFALHEAERAAWSEMVEARAGHSVHCRIAPLKGGNTVVWFVSEENGAHDPLSAWVWPMEGGAPHRHADAGASEPQVRDEGAA